MAKVLVTGSRDLAPHHRFTVERWLEAAFQEFYDDEHFDALVVGDCPTGGDLYAREWYHDKYMSAHGNSMSFSPGAPKLILGKANWFPDGPGTKRDRSAGPARNRWMVEQCDEGDICLAFFQEGSGNVGTGNCSLTAELAGLQVFKLWCPKDEGPVLPFDPTESLPSIGEQA